MQPVIIQDNISVPSGITSNVIVLNSSLRQYLRAPFNARGKLVAVSSLGGVRASLDYGSKNVCADCELRAASFIEEPYDILNEEWYLREGDQLVLAINNTNGGASNLRYRIILFPWEGDLPPDCRVMQRGPVTVNGGAVDQQLLDGLRYERPPVDSVAKVYASGSAAGLLLKMNVDTESIAPPGAVSASNTVPRDPLDQWIEGVEVPQDKLMQLPVSNPTGGALGMHWKVKLYEMYRS